MDSTHEDRPRTWWQTFKRAVMGFIDDDAMTFAAALAFYTALSFAPLLVVLLVCLSLFLGDAAQAELIAQLSQIAGPAAADLAEQILASGEAQPEVSSWAGIIGVVTLILSATGVFAQLQLSLNSIWGVAASASSGVLGWLRKRLLSLGMILAVGFLLLVSLGVSAMIELSLNYAGMSNKAGWLWVSLSNTISVGVFFLVFSGMYKYLPDVRIRWSDVWRGGLLTALLFALGKWGIGKYLGYSSVGSAYGAAGSLLVLLVWVYYSAIIVFFGAEMTQAVALKRGHPLVAETHAEPVDEAVEEAPPEPV